MRTSIADYKELIRSFVSNEISALQFEEKYLKLFKRDDSLDEKAYKVLSPLFWAVEDFCSSPELREEDDIDEQQLFEQAVTALEKLKQFDKNQADNEAAHLSRNTAENQTWQVSKTGQEDLPGFVPV